MLVNFNTLRVFSGSTVTAGAFEKKNLRWGYWNEQSPGLPLLINAGNRMVRGALDLAYEVEAYTLNYGDLGLTYILGGILNAEYESAVSSASVLAASGDYGLTYICAVSSASSLSLDRIVEATLTSDTTATETLIVNLTLGASLESVTEAHSVLLVEGQQYPVWAINAQTFAPSSYASFNFDSFAQVGNRYFAANENGLYELTGDDDDGAEIAATFMLARDPHKSSRPKHSGIAYLHGTSDGKMQVRVITAEGAVYNYKTEAALDDVVKARRVKFGRGVESHYWQLEVRNMNGDDFEVEQIELVTIHKERRV